MQKLLGGYSNQIFALLRIMAGTMFMLHGTAKMFGWPGDRPPVELMSQGGVAGVIELVCGALIAIGFLTTWAAFLSSGLMAFAYFIGHASGGFLPTVNGGELAVLYCFLWLYTASRGAGAWSIDGAIAKKGTSRGA